MMPLFVTLLFIIVVILGIDTYYVYSFSNIWTIAEPVIIYIFSAVVLIASILSTKEAMFLKRSILRLSFFVFEILLFLNIVRGIINYNSGVEIELLMYINTLLYVFIMALILLIGRIMFIYRKEYLSEKYEVK